MILPATILQNLCVFYMNFLPFAELRRMSFVVKARGSEDHTVSIELK